MRKIVQLIAAISIALVSTGCASILDRMMERGADRALEFRQDLFDPNEINIVLCGTNAPMPNPKRAESCTAVFVEGEMFLFDAGAGAFSSMVNLNLPIDKLSHIFLTHLHDDHMIEVGHVMNRSWLFGRENVLQVYGPKGTENMMEGWAKIYQLDSHYRVEHHGLHILDPKYGPPGKSQDVHVPGHNQLKTVYEKGPLKISAFLVDHGPIKPAFGYRIDYKGKSVVITGDTTEKGLPLEFVKNVDVLVSEVMHMDFPHGMAEKLHARDKTRAGTIMTDITNYHIGTYELGKLAQAANVKTVMLTHLVPGAIDFQPINNWMFKRPVAEHYDGEIIVGVDGSEYSIKTN